MNPIDFVKSEICEDFIESGVVSLKSELEVESIDCKGTFKLEFKQEIQETDDLTNAISTKQ